MASIFLFSKLEVPTLLEFFRDSDWASFDDRRSTKGHQLILELILSLGGPENNMM